MNQVYIALGFSEKFVKLGNFRVKVRDQSMNVYYNMDYGNNRTNMFDLNSGTYKNIENVHRSFHSSGRSHMKEEEKGVQLIKGQTSDGSAMNDLDKTALILGIESFVLDGVPMGEGTCDPNTLFLISPNGATRYSILWLWMPTAEAKAIHPRLFYINYIGNNAKYYTFQTAGMGDLASMLETQTVLTVNGWDIRALFLKSLLPLMTRDVMLENPKGIDPAWRSSVFVDSHLPLSEMMSVEALRKKPVLMTEPYIHPKARGPMAWIKYKR
ncbi:MAG: hypothetical protein K1000chlam1_01395 [Candidatus Anoxychlamydiales bacterium]|nr:hypothetical protein [Candidatus Anoxychlamydiales bacterium]